MNIFIYGNQNFKNEVNKILLNSKIETILEDVKIEDISNIDISDAYILNSDFESGVFENSNWNSGYYMNYNNAKIVFTFCSCNTSI